MSFECQYEQLIFSRSFQLHQEQILQKIKPEPQDQVIISQNNFALKEKIWQICLTLIGYTPFTPVP